jgi:hypothetical protein
MLYFAVFPNTMRYSKRLYKIKQYRKIVAYERRPILYRDGNLKSTYTELWE